MSFEKRKADKFLTRELALDIKLYHTSPEKLDIVKRINIERMLKNTWKDYKTYKGIPQ